MNKKNTASAAPHKALAVGRVSTDKVLFAVAMTLIIGFSIGAAVTLLGRSDGMVSAFLGNAQGLKPAPIEGKIRLSESILEKNPNDILVLIDLGNSYFDAGRYQEAVEAYLRALNIDPKNADVRNDLGIMYRELGQYDKAIDALRQAALDDPFNPRSRYNLGIVLACDMKDDRGAIDAFEEFLALGPCGDRKDKRIKMVKSEIDRLKSRTYDPSNR
jgi:cytochrome c-type biogenesis protein CcmH/NrfG